MPICRAVFPPRRAVFPPRRTHSCHQLSPDTQKTPVFTGVFCCVRSASYTCGAEFPHPLVDSLVFLLMVPDVGKQFPHSFCASALVRGHIWIRVCYKSFARFLVRPFLDNCLKRFRNRAILPYQFVRVIFHWPWPSCWIGATPWRPICLFSCCCTPIVRFWM